MRVKTIKASILNNRISLESLVQLSKPSVVKLSYLLGDFKVLVIEDFLGELLILNLNRLCYVLGEEVAIDMTLSVGLLVIRDELVDVDLLMGFQHLF